MIRRFAVTAVLSAAVAATLVAGATVTSAPTVGAPVTLIGMVTSLSTVRPDDSASQLVGQWRSDTGNAVLLLREDGTYGYSLGSSVFSTAEEGYFQVDGSQLTLTPKIRTGADSSGTKKIESS
ncbi:MAG: hypothetical protein ACRDQ4_21285 [Pseudonocardiaceae bacterium]